MDNYKEILQELREEYYKCNDLFLVAYNLNNNKYTKTEFTSTVTSFMTEIMQTLGFLIDEFEREEIENRILEDAAEIEADYDVDVSDCICDCSTCKNNVEFPPPHTCDICASLDQEEEFSMWEAKE